MPYEIQTIMFVLIIITDLHVHLTNKDFLTSQLENMEPTTDDGPSGEFRSYKIFYKGYM